MAMSILMRVASLVPMPQTQQFYAVLQCMTGVEDSVDDKRLYFGHDFRDLGGIIAAKTCYVHQQNYAMEG